MHQTLPLLQSGGFPAIRRRRLECLQVTDLVGRNLEGNAITVRDHCFGCTAGQGSSCGGALTSAI